MMGISIEKAIAEFKAANGEFEQGGKYVIVYIDANGCEREQGVDFSEIEGRSDMTTDGFLTMIWYYRISAEEYICDREYTEAEVDSVLGIKAVA